MSWDEFAERVGRAGFQVSPTAVRGYEEGRTKKVLLAYVEAVCRAFGASPSSFFADDLSGAQVSPDEAERQLAAIRRILLESKPPGQIRSEVPHDPESLRRRFLAAISDYSDLEVERLCGLNHETIRQYRQGQWPDRGPNASTEAKIERFLELHERRRTAAAIDEGELPPLIEGLFAFAEEWEQDQTLSATVNPDFAQVELDPAVLNLTVFESFFPERRPFFLEDSRTFQLPFRQFPLFHSRRIGRRPGRFSLEDGDLLIDQPDQTTIVGAAKVTGKADTWTYGVLSALTAREYATVDAVTVAGAGTETVTRVERLIEPRTSYNVARVQRDILGGSSTVGAIATAVVREQDADAFTGGVDHNFRWGRNLFQWSGHWVGTRAPFSDGPRTGFGGATRFSYFGKYFGFDGFFDHFSPNFRNTDLGFQRGRVDRTNVNGSFFLRQPDPWGIFRRVQLFVGGAGNWNSDRLALTRFANTGLSLQFRNFWQFNAFVGHNFRAFDDLDTRGGPPIVRPAGTFLNLNVGTDTRKSWWLFMGVNGSRNEEGGWNAGIGPNLSFQPSAQLQASVSMNYNIGNNVAQWVTNQDVNGDGETDYVYGRLRRNVINITGRATYAFHRDMTLEIFLQPFVAVGRYTNIRNLARPRSFEFEPATISFNPDFNRKSLRGNIVLRWEYLRGSTLFVVWNMSTSDDARPGEFSPFQDFGSAFGADGTHVFMIKLNYWLGL